MAAAPDPKLWRPAGDLAAPVLENAILSLSDLFRASLKAGSAVVRGRRFLNCRVEGPAVLLALDGVRFEGCDLGDGKGDMRSLLLKPMSPQRVTGAIPVSDCVFDRCSFFAIGFTGSDAFLDQFLAVPIAAPA